MASLHVASALLVAFLFYILAQRLHRTEGRHRSQPPGCESAAAYPHLDPIWGLDLLLQTWKEFHRGELSEGARRRHERFGRTFISTNLGQDCIYTIEPENIRTVTTHKFEHYGKSAWVEEASKHIGKGVLMSEGDLWKHSRAMLRPIFARNAIDEPTLVEPHLQNLARSLREAKGEEVDFRNYAARFMLDVVTEFLFSRPTNSLLDGADVNGGRHFLALVEQFESPSATFIAVGPLAWLELLPSYRQLLGFVTGMKEFFGKQLRSIIADKDYLAPSASTSCFRMMKDDDVPEVQIQAELQNIFFASFDTTTAFLANVVDILSRRQDVQQKLRREIAYLHGSPPTKQDLAMMAFWQYVLQEALRLYTPVALHSRQANRDTILPKGGGPDGDSPLFVRAGTSITWSIYSLNRDPRYYGPDWAEFRPERWEAVPATGNAFMPFGSGPRACLGQQIAQTEIAYSVVRLLQEFSVVECADTRPFKEAKAVSFYNAYGTLVQLR